MLPFSFFLLPPPAPTDLHSFPTRRSSDLGLQNFDAQKVAFAVDVSYVQVERAVRNHLEAAGPVKLFGRAADLQDRKSTRLNSSHVAISYAVFCLKKKNNEVTRMHDELHSA